MKLYILSTCDEWKSTDSMRNYYIGRSSKAGTKRLAKVIADGIKDGTFEYLSDYSIDDQLSFLQEDLDRGCIDFYLALGNNLQYGVVELVECDDYA